MTRNRVQRGIERHPLFWVEIAFLSGCVVTGGYLAAIGVLRLG